MSNRAPHPEPSPHMSVTLDPNPRGGQAPTRRPRHLVVRPPPAAPPLPPTVHRRFLLHSSTAPSSTPSSTSSLRLARIWLGRPVRVRRQPPRRTCSPHVRATRRRRGCAPHRLQRARVGMAPAGAGLAKTRPQANPHPHPRISGGFRVPAGLTTDIIKMYKFINLNSQITHFYK